jgi:predicted HicB family RNase H-like nuclease
VHSFANPVQFAKKPRKKKMTGARIVRKDMRNVHCAAAEAAASSLQLNPLVNTSIKLG